MAGNVVGAEGIAEREKEKKRERFLYFSQNPMQCQLEMEKPFCAHLERV